MATTRAAAAAASTPPVTPTYSHPLTSLSHSIENLDGSMATRKSNYVAWKFRILQILKVKGLARVLEDGSAEDSGINNAVKEWKKKNNQAFTMISLNICHSQIPHIETARNAQEARDAVATVHQGIGSNGRMVLMQRIWSLHLKEGQDMSAHVNKFKELATQVANL